MNERVWHDVCSLDELEQRGHAVARIGGREIGVLRAGDGTPYAVRNRCPHHGAPMCRGEVRERFESDLPGTYGGASGLVIRCPWHGWEFRVEDGRCPDDPRMRVAVYDVRVSDGRVLVHA